MIDVPGIMRVAADLLENYSERVRTAQEDGSVDAQAILNSLVTLSAGASIAAREAFDGLPRPGKRSEEDLDVNVAVEVDRIVGLMGLVQEEELAALRKRVVELEKLVASVKKAPVAKKAPAKRATTKKSSPTKQ
jgi:hypothetical protein